MFKCFDFKLIILFAGLSSAQISADEAKFLGSFDWAGPGIGGISGIEIEPDGSGFWAINDRGGIIRGMLERDEVGQIRAVHSQAPKDILFFDTGVPLNQPHSDSEGLALSENGDLFVSFEQIPRVRGLALDALNTTWIPEHPDFADLQLNAALEALAVDGAGALYMLAERSGGLNRPFTVYRVKDRKWDIPFTIPRRGKFLPVGADFGPDGRFFLLERAFLGAWGFRSRVRVFDIAEDQIVHESVAFETTTSEHDNLEGISVWMDSTGQLRMTMVSDDNFFLLQQTKIVEYALPQ